jgi:arsenate reductase
MTEKKAIIWHNPRCSKSRGALQILQEQGIPVEERRYLDNPPSTQDLNEVLKLLNVAPSAIVRTKEAEYKELGLQDKDLSHDEWLAVLNEHPHLIERPIVIYKGRAIVARPPEKVLEILD